MSGPRRDGRAGCRVASLRDTGAAARSGCRKSRAIGVVVQFAMVRPCSGSRWWFASRDEVVMVEAHHLVYMRDDLPPFALSLSG